MLKRLLVPILALALLGAVPAVALADDGTTTTTEAKPDDPGIAALHEAIQGFKEDREALRASCTDRATREACKKKFFELLDEFKAARKAALEEHHAFVEKRKADHAKPDAVKKEDARKKSDQKKKKETARAAAMRAKLERALKSVDAALARARAEGANPEVIAKYERHRAELLSKLGRLLASR